MRVFVFISIFFLLFFQSCIFDSDDITTNNTEAKGPAVYTLELDNIEPGQHITGIIDIPVNTDTIRYQIEYLELMIDAAEVQKDESYPYKFRLNTRAFSGGEHQLSIVVKTRDMNHGLLNLLDVPSVIFSTFLYFDHSSLPPMQLDSVVWDEGHPKLFWTPPENSNIYSYIIHRVDWRGYEKWLDTLYTSSASTFRDSTFEQIIGNNTVRYDLRISNRVESYSTKYVYMSFGHKLDCYPARKPLKSSTADEIWYKAGGELRVFSTVDHSVTRKIALPVSYQGKDYYLQDFALNKAEDLVFLLVYESNISSIQNNSIAILDAGNFNLINFIPLNQRTSFLAVGENNQLYYVNINGVLYSVNYRTGKPSSYLQGLAQSDNVEMLISPNRERLYIVDRQETAAGRLKLSCVDVSDTTMTLVKQVIKTPCASYGKMLLTPDGRTLTLMFADDTNVNHRKVHFWDAEELIDLNAYWPDFYEMGADYLVDFCIGDNGRIYAACNSNQYYPATPGVIFEYNLQSRQLLNTWNTLNNIKYILTTPGNDYLYTFVLADHPVNYFIALN